MNFHRWQQRIKHEPDNLWLIYELCKVVGDVTEVDRVDFNSASLKEKQKIINQIVPFANLAALQKGVKEYHYSMEYQN